MTDTTRSVALPPLTLNAWLRWDVIEPHVRRIAPDRVLELGPGSGTVAARLAAMSSEYVGVEPDAANRAIAAPRLPASARLLSALDELGADDPGFDLVAAFEVLEHLADDRDHLRQWVRHCRAGGSVLISVPAHRKRFGPHDTWAAHLRRYERDELAALGMHCGLTDISVEAYGGLLGYPLEWARNALARRHLGTDRGSAAEQTATSARTRQTPAAFRLATQWGTFPFRIVQRPLRRSTMGTGFVLSGRRVE